VAWRAFARLAAASLAFSFYYDRLQIQFFIQQNKIGVGAGFDDTP
jgi:hypothetical protein